VVVSLRRLVHLVEDENGLRLLLRRLLESSGYEVAEYPSGEHFLGCIDDIEPGCILLDVNMPGADGFEVQGRLRARGMEWPVIMMTGAGDVTVLALKAGARDLMNKPFARPELSAAFEDAFEQDLSATVKGRERGRSSQS